MFGMGERTPIQDNKEIFWSNSTQGVNYSVREEIPSVNYVFNPDYPALAQSRNYTTEGFNNVTGTPTVNVTLKGDNSESRLMTPGIVRVYKQDDASGKEIKMLMLDGKAIADCEDTYCPTSIVESLEYSPVNHTGAYYSVIDVQGDESAPPTMIGLKDPYAGDVSTESLEDSVNRRSNITREQSLTLTETSSAIASKNAFNNADKMTHIIKKADGTEENIDFSFNKTGTETWTTPK
jgi:hypothetical protein